MVNVAAKGSVIGPFVISLPARNSARCRAGEGGGKIARCPSAVSQDGRDAPVRESSTRFLPYEGREMRGQRGATEQPNGTPGFSRSYSICSFAMGWPSSDGRLPGPVGSVWRLRPAESSRSYRFARALDILIGESGVRGYEYSESPRFTAFAVQLMIAIFWCWRLMA